MYVLFPSVGIMAMAITQNPTWLLNCLLTSSLLLPATSVAPDCVYEGRYFSGEYRDYTDLTHYCENNFGGALSVAFTLSVVEQRDWVRVFDFGIAFDDKQVTVALSPTSEMLVQFNNDGQREYLNAWTVALNEKRRYLLSISASGSAKFWRDGSLDYSGELGPLPQETRTLLLGKDLTSAPLLKGVVQDFWVWHSEVGWDSASGSSFTTATTMAVPVAPDCSWTGKTFTGNSGDYHNLGTASSCATSFGGALSVAFTLSVAEHRAWSTVFDFSIAFDDKQIILLLSNQNNLVIQMNNGAGRTYLHGWSVQLNDKRRYLFSLSASGMGKLWRDGHLDSQGQLEPLAQATRNLWVAKEATANNPVFKGTVEGFQHWHAEVDWASASRTESSASTTWTWTYHPYAFLADSIGANDLSEADAKEACGATCGCTGVTCVTSSGLCAIATSARPLPSATERSWVIGGSVLTCTTTTSTSLTSTTTATTTSTSTTSGTSTFTTTTTTTSTTLTTSSTSTVSSSTSTSTSSTSGSSTSTSSATTTTSFTSSSSSSSSTHSSTTTSSGTSTFTTTTTTTSTTLTTSSTSTASSSTSTSTSSTSVSSTSTSGTSSTSSTSSSASTTTSFTSSSTSSSSTLSSTTTSSGTSTFTTTTTTTSATFTTSSTSTVTSSISTATSSTSGSSTSTSSATTTSSTSSSASTTTSFTTSSTSSSSTLSSTTTSSGTLTSTSSTSGSSTSTSGTSSTSRSSSTSSTISSTTTSSGSSTTTTTATSTTFTISSTSTTRSSTTRSSTTSSSPTVTTSFTSSSSPSTTTLSGTSSTRLSTSSSSTATTVTSSKSSSSKSTTATTTSAGAATSTSSRASSSSTTSTVLSSSSRSKTTTTVEPNVTNTSSTTANVEVASTPTTTTMTTGMETAAEIARPEEAVIANALAAVEREVASLLSDFASNNVSSLAQNVTGGVLVAARLDNLASGGDADFVTIDLQVEEAPALARKPRAEVRVPTEVFRSLLASVPAADGLVLAVTAYESDGEDSLVKGMDSVVGNVRTEVKGAMTIDLTSLAGLKIAVENLTKPITFSMPLDYSEGMKCAFWDEKQKFWSNEGVSVNSASTIGGQLFCDTWHLSLFGAIFQGFLDAFLCSQLSLFNEEALMEMLHGSWKTSPGALLFWALLGCMASVFLISAHLDRQRERKFHWSPEFFLIPSQSRKPEEVEAEDLEQEVSDESLRIHKGFLYCFVLKLIACVNVCCACCRENALRDAIDEIVAEWFENFGEVRTLGESIWESLEIGAISAGRFCHMSRTVMSRLVLTSSRRLAAASMGLNGHVVNFVLDDKEIAGLLMRRHARHAEDIRRSMIARRARAAGALPAGEAGEAGETLSEAAETNNRRRDWRLCTSRDEAWWALHEEVCEHIERHVAKVGWFALPQKVWIIFCSQNPLGVVFAHNIFMSCKMTCFFRILELTGDLMAVCIFFDASGAASPKDDEEECGAGGELADSMAYKAGRIIAIATGSIVFAGLPVMLLHSLHTRHFKHFPYEGCPEWRRQLRAWKIQDAVIWVVGSAYFAFALTFICLFLSNISNDDHTDWSETGAFTLLQDAVVVPLSVALIMPTLCNMLISAISAGARVNQDDLVREVHQRLHESTNVMLPIVML